MTHLEDCRTSRFEIRLAESNDPLASKISWKSARTTGTFFKSQTLKLAKDIAELRSSTRATLTGYIVFFSSFAALIAGIPYCVANENFLASFFLLIWGGVFGNVGYQLLAGSDRITFDKNKGSFSINGHKLIGRIGRLEEIYAIQLIRANNSLVSYEMNLVFTDGDRANLMSGSDYEEIQSYSIDLAAFLNVPIWKSY